MGEATDQIERHIDEKRHELDENIHELQYKVKRAVDWRAQVEERPWTMVGIAFGLGVVGSLAIGRAISGRRRHRTEWQSESRPRNARNSAVWDNIRAAVMAVVVATAKEFVEKVVPGFNEQYQRHASEHRSLAVSESE